MKQFITNSNTLHFLLLHLGLKFTAEDRPPYRLYNGWRQIAFFPCDETLEDNKILMMYDKEYLMPGAYFPRWKPITSENTKDEDLTDFFKLFAYK